MDKKTHEVFYEKLTFIYLEMSNFVKSEPMLETHFDKWMFVLKNLSRLQERPQKLQEKIFEKLFNEAEVAKLTPEDMTAYEQSLKTHWDNYSVMESLREEARKEGMEEGLKEGKHVGILAVARELKKTVQPRT